MWSGFELQVPTKSVPICVSCMFESGSMVPSPQSTWTWYWYNSPTKFVELTEPSRCIGFVRTVNGEGCPFTLSMVTVHVWTVAKTVSSPNDEMRNVNTSSEAVIFFVFLSIRFFEFMLFWWYIFFSSFSLFRVASISLV